MTKTAPKTAWRPGTSGNPGGRPKVVGHVRDLARTHTEEAIKALADIMRDPSEKGAARVRAAEALLDRAWGRAPSITAIELTGEGATALAGVFGGIAARELALSPVAAQLETGRTSGEG